MIVGGPPSSQGTDDHQPPRPGYRPGDRQERPKQARPLAEPVSPRRKPRQPPPPRSPEPGPRDRRQDRQEPPRRGGVQPHQQTVASVAARHNLPTELPADRHLRERALLDLLRGPSFLPEGMGDFRPPDRILNEATHYHVYRQDGHQEGELRGMFSPDPWTWLTFDAKDYVHGFDTCPRIWETVWQFPTFSTTFFASAPT